MKQFIFFFIFLTAITACSKTGPYDVSANAKMDIQQALTAAKTNQTPLLIVFGANWCADCRGLDVALTSGESAKKISNAFKLVKVNIGNFDTNLDIAKRYGNPIGGGIPGAAILAPDGTILYVTKPGELTTARKKQADGLYNFLKQASNHAKS